MRFCLNSKRKIIIRVTSSKRYQNVRSDQTILGPFANVTLTLCVSWVNAFYWYQIFALDSAVVEVQEMFSSLGGLLTNAMYHHGETL